MMASAPGLGWPGRPDRRGQRYQPGAVAAVPPAGAPVSASGQAAARQAGSSAGLGWPGDGDAASWSVVSSGRPAAVSRETSAGGDPAGTAAMREGETDMTENLVQARAE